MSFLFSQPAPGILPANSVDFSEVETIAANTLLGNNTGASSVIQELSVANVSTMLNLAQYLTSVSGSSPISSSGGTTPTISISQSSALANGYLSSADWSTFNAKQSALTFGNVSESTSSVLTLSGATGAVIGSGLTIQVKQASAAQDGYLSSVDWNTFNNKQPAGTYVNSVGGTAPIVSSGGVTPSISINNFGGADGVLPGSKGAVPAPAFDDNTKYLKGDGTWAAISTLPSQTSNGYKVLATDGSSASWQYAGLGDGNFGTDNVILGRSKPTLLAGTANTIVGSGSGTALTTGSSNVIVGTSSATSLTTGTNSIAIGNNARLNSNASLSIVIGTNTGSNTTGADRLIAIGNEAGGYASGGAISQTIAIGDETCRGVAPNRATVIGHYAGRTGATDYDTIIGYAAGYTGTLGRNSFLGHQAGYQAGYYSVALGAFAANNNNSNYCVAIGYEALNNPASANQSGNVAIAMQSLYNVNGNNNIGIGYQAGYNASGDRSLLLGLWAGSYATGNEFYVAGYSARKANVTQERDSSLLYGTFSDTVSSQTLKVNAALTSTYGFVANEIGGDYDTRIEGDTDANLIFVDASTDRVGIGLNNPSAKLEVSGDSQLNGALVVNEAGADKDTRIEGDTDANLVFVDASTDKVGIGTATPAEKLEVNGNLKVTTGDVLIATAGKGLSVKSGTDAKIGVTTVFPGGGTNTVTVSTTAVTANSIIFISAISGATTIDPKIWVSTITAGTSFVISSGDNSFTGTVGWMIVESV